MLYLDIAVSSTQRYADITSATPLTTTQSGDFAIMPFKIIVCVRELCRLHKTTVL